MIAAWKRRASELKREVYALYYACRDRRVPWYAKWLAVGVVAYAFSPIDLIPDFIPVLGYLDELVLLPLGIMAVRAMVPADVMSECRAKAAQLESKPRSWAAAAVIVAIWVGISVAAIAAVLAGVARAAPGGVTLTHVHGLAFSPDGKRLMIPSHHGLAVYEAGRWSKAPGPEHDYMGFSANARGLYSSGHPAPASGLVNPFGLIRSRDGGKTWEKLGLEGETDFHLLATSWNANAIYVWNPAPSSRMKAAGLHYTVNDGFAWKRASASGLRGAPRAIAVHPDEAAIVAMATSEGLYLSRDSGERFTKAADGGQGLSAFFDLEGRHLWYGSFDGQPGLARIPLGDDAPVKIVLPPLQDDAVAYIAQNPARTREYAIATFRRSVYISENTGESWAPIAEGGRAK